MSFSENAPSANPVFFRTYSRRTEEGRESWDDVCDRTLRGLVELGKLTEEEAQLIDRQQRSLHSLTSGRWLWVGGTDWIEKPENAYGSYNCSSTSVVDWDAFGLMMGLAMMGCGTGAILEQHLIDRLPPVCNKLKVSIVREIGAVPKGERDEETSLWLKGDDQILMTVGDSRQGWVDSYQALMELASSNNYNGVWLEESEAIVNPSATPYERSITVEVDLGHVRPAGEKLKGFGGISNPSKLSGLYDRVAKILNGAVGRKLTSVECCLLIDEAALVVVAGNLRRSAGMRQFEEHDLAGATAKENLWQQDEDGNWRIDPDRDALRMANHTRTFHRKPTLEEVKESVTKQFYSGEGAIQYVPEAIARGSADILPSPDLKQSFIDAYIKGEGKKWIWKRHPEMDAKELEHRMERYGLNPCLRGDMKILTSEGYKFIEELAGKDVTLINADGVESRGKVWSSGIKPTVKLCLTKGDPIYCTPDHRWMTSDGDEVESKDLVGKKLMPFLQRTNHDPIAVSMGFIQGDGETHRLIDPEFKGIAVNIGKKDHDILDVFDQAEINYKWHGDRRIYSQNGRNFCIQWGLVPLPLPERTLPHSFFERQDSDRAGFLCGLYSANGSILSSGRVTLKTTCLKLANQVVEALHCFGIGAYITKNKAHLNEFANGVYQCRESYDVNIQEYSSRVKFFSSIGFALKYKMDKLAKVLVDQAPAVRACQESDSVEVYDFSEPLINWGVVEGFVSHNCGEILLNNNFCNLGEVHLNTIAPHDYETQEEAFKAGALSVASLLHHRFTEERYQYSREVDPIVGVSFTGLFDFFVEAFGVEWLHWWEAGRPRNWSIHGKTTQYYLSDYFYEKEKEVLDGWRTIVEETVWDYCDRHGLRRPNRCTTTQPAGCLTADAVRVFDQGLLFADEHMEESSGDIDLAEFGLSVRNGMRVRSGIANKKMDLLKVTLVNGRQITMTRNHRLSIDGNWTRADELKIGQIIDFSVGRYQNAEECPLDYVDIQMGLTGRQPLGCSLPSRMSSDLAYFIGALFGNGSFSERGYRIRFSHGNIDVLNKLSQIGLRLFGLKGVLKKDGLNRHELCFANKQLYLWFLSNEMHKPTKSKYLDRIPQKVRMSSMRSILAFFAGLIDTDGCIRKQGSVSIDSSSEAFIRHLQQIGECVGLCFSVFHNTQGQNLQGEKDMFGLCLSRMISVPESLLVLNQHSIKAQSRTITPAARSFKFSPYQIESIEEVNDFTYDYAVDGVDDDDSWYWQGALKSHNSKSLLTGASPGWHPPKAARFIRRITFAKNDPVALACLDYGYPIVPSQSDTDRDGNLLNDPFDDRCTEWLVEIPTEVSWANIPGADRVNISQFSATAQFDFYMQVQRHYVRHNTSATIELRSHEIEPLAEAIHKAIENDGGYISAALLARFDDHQAFPRLPFEPISKEEYDRLHAEVLSRRKTGNFLEALSKHDRGESDEAGPAGCDSDKCLFPQQMPK